jgi:hypothetical protein
MRESSNGRIDYRSHNRPRHSRESRRHAIRFGNEAKTLILELMRPEVLPINELETERMCDEYGVSARQRERLSDDEWFQLKVAVYHRYGTPYVKGRR